MMMQWFIQWRRKRFWLVVVLGLFLVWTFLPMGKTVVIDGAGTTVAIGYGEGAFNRTDYFRYLNDINGAGVETEDNAAVWLLRGFGPKMKLFGGELKFDDAAMSEIYALLGMAVLGEGDDYYEHYDYYCRRLWEDKKKVLLEAYDEEVLGEAFREGRVREFVDGGSGGMLTNQHFKFDSRWDEYEFDESFSRAFKGVWRGGDEPAVLKWLEAHKGSLDLFVRAGECSQYYFPYVRCGDFQDVIDDHYYYFQMIRTVAVSMHIRGNYRLGKGDFDGAIEDFLTIIKIVRLKRGNIGVHTDYHWLLTHAERWGFELLHQTAKVKGFSLSHSRKIIEAIEKLPEPARMIDVFDVGERIHALDVVQGVSLGEMGLSYVGETLHNLDEEGRGRVQLEVNDQLRRMNGIFDGWVKKIRVGGTFLSDGSNLGKVEKLQYLLNELALLPEQWVRWKKNDAAGEILGVYLEAIYFHEYLAIEKIARMRSGVLKIGIGLELYKQEFGVYPKGLGELVGRYGIGLRAEDLLGVNGKAMVLKVTKLGLVRLQCLAGGVDEDGKVVDYEFKMGVEDAE